MVIPPSSTVSPTDSANRGEKPTFNPVNRTAPTAHSTACTVTSRSGP